jgi:hypothetical protein
VKLLSDHDLLKNRDTDWKDGGAIYPKPEWTAAAQHPVSHSMNKKVKIEVVIEVLPADGCPETGTLRGECPEGYSATASKAMVLEKASVEFKPGMGPVTLESDLELKRQIQELDFKIQWTAQGASVAIAPAQTANTMYVTMDTPTTPRQPGVTVKRMRHAVKATGGAGSLNPHDIVKHVKSKWSRFNLSQVYDNEWELAGDAKDPITGALIGADCQTIVRHTESVIRMVGCPGTAEFIVVWAKVPTPAQGEENPAYTPNVSNPKQWYDDFNPVNAAKATWRATLIDGDGNAKKYEAGLRFEYGGVKKYNAGGVGSFDNANQVIRVFSTMSWIDNATVAKKDVIHTY